MHTKEINSVPNLSGEQRSEMMYCEELACLVRKWAVLVGMAVATYITLWRNMGHSVERNGKCVGPVTHSSPSGQPLEMQGWTRCDCGQLKCPAGREWVLGLALTYTCQHQIPTAELNTSHSTIRKK